MTTFDSLSSLTEMINPLDIERDYTIVAEFIDYIRWLANQDTGKKIDIGTIWALYHESVLVCRIWSDVCEELNLPIRENWSKP